MNKEQKLSNILKTFEKIGFKSETIKDELQQPYQIELESWTDGGVDMIEYLDFSNNPQEIYDEHVVFSKLHDCYQDFSDNQIKYNKIVKCDLYTFNNDIKMYENCYLLTYDDCPDTLEIELTSDFCFNTEFVAKNREVVGEINNFGELTNFMKRNDITIYNPQTQEKTLFLDDIKLDEENKIFYVGGSRDYVLDFDLNILGWEEEIDFLNKKESEVEL